MRHSSWADRPGSRPPGATAPRPPPAVVAAATTARGGCAGRGAVAGTILPLRPARRAGLLGSMASGIATGGRMRGDRPGRGAGAYYVPGAAPRTDPLTPLP